MNIETTLKSILAAILFPLLAILLFVLGSIALSAKEAAVSATFAALFSFFVLAGALSVRILLFSPNRYLRRLNDITAAPPEIVDISLRYFESRTFTLKMCAAFGALLGLAHLAELAFGHLSLQALMISLVSSLAFPIVLFLKFARHHWRVLRALRQIRSAPPAIRLDTARQLATYWPTDPVAGAILRKLEEIRL